MPPPAERLAGTGLAIAAATILALALVIMVDLDREAELHRDVIARLHAKDSLEALRVQLNDLAHSARVAALDRNPAALQAIARRTVEIDAELAYLQEQPSRDDPGAAFEALAHAARALSVNARSVNAAAGAAPTAEIERLAQEASVALERTLHAHNASINERTLAQIRVGESLRRYVAWLVPGAFVVLVGLFGFYRWAKARERDARRRIEHLAHHDMVTGLPNRALLADRLAQEIARDRRDGAEFAVAMFDLDGFKAVNDTWGHAAGDSLLAMVARRARACLRASDTLGRLGGDEFLAILPATGGEGALEVAEKLRGALAEPFALGGPVASVGASVGVAVFPAHGGDAQSLQRAADAALYDAKAGGKNRVRLAATPSAATPAPRRAAEAPA